MLRRVWEGLNPSFWASSPSPDGRSVTEIDWPDGDLAVLDLITGEKRPLTDNDPSDGYNNAEGSVFSPDGRQVAYTWYDDAADGYQLRVVAVDGSSDPTVLLASRPGVPYLYPEDWSADGTRILVRADLFGGGYQLESIDVLGGTLEVLGAFDHQDKPIATALPPPSILVHNSLPSASYLRKSKEPAT